MPRSGLEDFLEMGIKEQKVDFMTLDPFPFVKDDPFCMKRFKILNGAGTSKKDRLNFSLPFLIRDPPAPQPARISHDHRISGEAGNPMVVPGLDEHQVVGRFPDLFEVPGKRDLKGVKEDRVLVSVPEKTEVPDRRGALKQGQRYGKRPEAAMDPFEGESGKRSKEQE